MSPNATSPAVSDRPFDIDIFVMATPAAASDTDPLRVYLATHLTTAASRRAMYGQLCAVARLLAGCAPEDLPWHRLRRQHVQAAKAAMMERGAAPSTINLALSAVKGVLGEAWRLNLLPAEDYARAVDVKGVRGERLPAGRSLTAGEISAVLATCMADPSPGGIRDAALLTTLYSAGLRRAEAVGLDLLHFDGESGQVTIVEGKGGKSRASFLAPGAVAAVMDWIQLRGDTLGPLFLPIAKGGRIRWERLTPQACRVVAVKRARQAHIAEFSPHDMRRTCAGDMLDAGADISSVQRQLGHASVVTTQRYDRRPLAAVRRAAHLLSVPYVRRPALFTEATS